MGLMLKYSEVKVIHNIAMLGICEETRVYRPRVPELQPKPSKGWLYARWATKRASDLRKATENWLCAPLAESDVLPEMAGSM